MASKKPKSKSKSKKTSSSRTAASKKLKKKALTKPPKRKPAKKKPPTKPSARAAASKKPKKGTVKKPAKKKSAAKKRALVARAATFAENVERCNAGTAVWFVVAGGIEHAAIQRRGGEGSVLILTDAGVTEVVPVGNLFETADEARAARYR